MENETIVDLSILNEAVFELWKEINKSGYFKENIQNHIKDKKTEPTTVIKFNSDYKATEFFYIKNNITPKLDSENIISYEDVFNRIRQRSPYLYGSKYTTGSVLFIGCNYSDTWEKKLISDLYDLANLPLHKEYQKMDFADFKDKCKLMKIETSVYDQVRRLENGNVDDHVNHYITVIIGLLNSLSWSGIKDLHPNDEIVMNLVNGQQGSMSLILDTISRVSKGSWTSYYLDMFWMRFTKESQLKPLLVYSNTINELDYTDFAQRQLATFKESILMLKPRVIVATDAFVSEILMNEMGLNSNDIRPSYETNAFNGLDINVVLGGMLFGQRTMDRWSQARLKATIQAIVDNKKT
jgi:hypothetical protein